MPNIEGGRLHIQKEGDCSSSFCILSIKKMVNNSKIGQLQSYSNMHTPFQTLSWQQ